ncbi:response regulator [Kurthia massiliensis]|uniref:response regulator n=1 Tax=Kurthia massiliensis TaxID=1033739 RepID=UPI0002881797|nr:response regulator [Kurthia massiliensis]
MKKMLIVDDSLFIRETIKRMIETAEVDIEIVAEATNGEEAVALYRAHRPDIVTMDITMPRKNGLDATKEICTAFPNAKIIIITAVGQQKNVIAAIENGAVDFMKKPFTQQRLIEMLQQHLEV